MAFYLDTSALVKRYIQESGSDRVQNITNLSDSLFISLITYVEAVAALTRRSKESRMMKSAMTQALATFRNEFDQRFFRTIAPTKTLLLNASKLAEKHYLRGYDAIQLASVVTVVEYLRGQGVLNLVFVCADVELIIAAKAEGLTVEAI